MYEYEFKKGLCWYKDVCSLYNTQQCTRSCVRYMEMHFLMNSSGLPRNKQYRQLLVPSEQDISAFMELQDIKDHITDFVGSGKNLYIYSRNFGNGKTTWAIKILQQFFNQVWAGNGFRVRGIFLHVPTFLFKIKECISRPDEDFEAIRSKLLSADVVIWDDIAATKLSDYDHANLLTYIDQRVFAGKTNIYTGNLIGREVIGALGNRLSSRVVNESKVVELVGLDRRGTK